LRITATGASKKTIVIHHLDDFPYEQTGRGKWTHSAPEKSTGEPFSGDGTVEVAVSVVGC